MKVLIESKSPLSKFFELKPGQVFRSTTSNDVYMKVFEDREAEPGELVPNAVELETGELQYFGAEILVEKLNAVLHIR